MQGEREGGAVREVGDEHGVGAAAGLVQDDQVGDVLGGAGGGEGADDGVATVETVGVGEDEAEFLGKSRKRLATSTQKAKRVEGRGESSG